MSETTRIIRIVVDSSKARSGSEESRRALKAMEDQAAATRGSMDKLSSGVGTMMRGFAAAAAIVAVVGTIKAFATGIALAGDEVRTMTARFNVLTGAADGSRAAFDSVYRVARNAGVGLKETGDAFARLAIAAGEVGATTDQIARVTDTVLKLGRIGGASSQELSSGVMQLGQALASGRLQGDELRAILEGMPLVGKAIAKEFGVGLGELRKLGEEGKLVTDRVLKAMINAGSDVDAQFRKLPPTLEQAGTRAGNAWQLLKSALDDSLGVSRTLSSGLDAAADHAEKLAARIAGGMTQAIRDLRAEAAALQAQADKAKGGGIAAAPPPPKPTSPTFFGTGRATDHETITSGRNEYLAGRAASLAGELERFQNENDYITRREEAERAAAKAAAKAAADADALLRDIREKASPAAKVLREFNNERAKLDELYKKGAIDVAQYAEGLGHLQDKLKQTGGAAKATAESVKAMNEATRNADLAKLMADSAGKGAEHLAELEARAKAAEKAIDTLGKRDKAWEADFAGKLMSERADKFRLGFLQETDEIERQNKLLEAQVRLAGERPEIVEREIALLRVKLDLEARGQKIGEDDLQRRADALTAQDKLNRQLEEGKRSAELWAEPFKNAIQSVQSTMTDLFEKIFSGGLRSFSDLGAALKGIWFKLMAEMASVAVIRPVIQFAVGGLGSLGLIGPQTMQAFGVTGGGGSAIQGAGSSGGASSGGGGFNPFNMFGSGGFSGMLGSVGRWLNTPFGAMGGGQGLGSLMAGGGRFGDVGSLISSGAAGQLPGSGLSGFFGGITPMQGIGALAGIGSGIFQLASGGGSASSIIGGVGSMIGAGVSLIPGIGQVAGPIIAIASSLLGGLFKSKPQYAAQGFHAYNPATGRYGGRVGYETNMKAPLAPSIGNDVLKLISAFGGSVAEGRSAPEYYLWRGFEDGRMDATVTAEGSPTYARLLAKAWASGQVKTTDEAQWAARTELWTDEARGGEWTQLPINSLTTDSDKLMQQLALLILKAGVRDGAFAGLSATSEKIIRNYPDADTQGLGQALEWGKKTYDVLVRTDTITNAEKALGDLRDSFQAAIMKAEEYGLATDKLVAAQSRAITKYATDFGQGVEDQLLGMSDPAALQRVQIERERELALKEWDFLQQEFLKGNISTLIERNKVQQLYDEKLKAITSQTLASLENFERRIRYGDLSAANPLESLAGSVGAYEANTAKALAGDTAAINQYEAFAQAALQQTQAYYGNTYATEVFRTQLLEDIAVIMGRTPGEPAAAPAELAASMANIERLLQEFLDRQQAA